MNIKYNFNYDDIFRSYIFIIITQLLLSLIKSQLCNNCEIFGNICRLKNDATDGNNCNCETARPHFDDKKCYQCKSLLEFYNIYSNETCEIKSSCNYKILIETNECIGHCPDNYCEFGEYCYNINSEDFINIYHLEIKDNFYCKCMRDYKKQKISSVGEKDKYKCVDNCDTLYYNSDTEECVENCGTNTKKKISDNQWRCSSKCEYNECEYYDGTNIYCLSENDEGKYIYNEKELFIYEKIDGSKQCVDQCNKEDIYDGSKCVEKCTLNSYIIFSDLGSEDFVKRCDNSITGLFEYNGIYFPDCSLTQKLFKNNTFKFEDGDKKLCVEDCSFIDKKYFLDGEECVDKCGLARQYYYNQICLQNCSIGDNKHEFNMDMNFGQPLENSNDFIENTITIKKDDYPDPFQCLEQCPRGTYIDKNKNKCYISKCDEGKYINSNLECDICNKKKSSDSTSPGEGYIFDQIIYIKTESDVSNPNDGGRRLEGEYVIYNITRQFCLSSCPKSAPYYDFGENICYSLNCSERRRFSAYDYPYICYDSCNNITGGYNNEKDYICYKEQVGCDKDYFYMKNGIKQCADETDCKNEHLYYIQNKQCVKDCESNYYKIEKKYNNDGNVQDLGSCFSDPKDCINQGYIFFDNITKICDNNCSSSRELYRTFPEIVQNEDNQTCFESCPQNYPYKDNKRRYCLKECDNFFYKYDCLEDCGEYYHFINSNECIDNCKIDDNFYYFNVEDTNKICYYSCPSEAPFVINKNPSNQQSKPYECKKSCNVSSPYYYDDLKECREDCGLFNSNHTMCVYQCEPGEKVDVYNKICIKDCPKEFPYILKEKLSDTTETIVEKCVKNCPEGFPLISYKNNICLKECLLEENYDYNGFCYEKCPNGTYSDDYNKKCFKDGCPSDLYKYYEEENGIYKCTKSCSSEKFYTLEGSECSESCPKGYNYIGNDYICLKDLKDCLKYGEYYEEFYNNSFKCLKTCDNLIVNDNNNIKKCVSKCPEDYYESPNKMCYKLCKSNDEEYPFSTIDEYNKTVCSKKCNDLQPYYDKNNKCRDKCDDLEETKIIDYDNRCVSSCTNPYYQYIENGKCVYKCSKYVNYKKECVNVCDGDYNYIEENECKKSCDETNFAEQVNITNTMFECKTKCSSGKYYYEEGNIFTVRKCFDDCRNDFKIQDTNICSIKCPSDYYSYYNVTSDKTYKSCVKKCPDDKKYIYLSQCYSECPSEQKYHLEGEVNCRSECPKGSKIENNECKSQCSDGKFLDNNQCVDNCTNPNVYYMEGSNICVKNCEVGFYIEGKECVKSCKFNSFINETIQSCVNRCESGNYYVNITEEGTKKICIDKCPNYTYFDNKTNHYICKDECNFKLNGTNVCKDICDGEYHFYDSKNGNCLLNCPENHFYINEAQYLDNNTICYTKCPNNYPYHDTSSNVCSNKCDSGYLNYTSKECTENCIGKIFEDNEIKYCLNECKDLGLFEFEDKCTRNCSEEGKDLVGNMETKECQCSNLSYINEDNRTVCVDKCPDGFKYRLFKTRQCLKNCKDNGYILSLDEQYCYRTKDKCPLNTEQKPYTKNNETANYKCDCSYKFYKINNDEIICLGENEECPNEYRYITEGTSECVKNCEPNKTLGNICLKDNTINSNQYWYISETDKEYHITDDCTKIGFFLIEDLNQCVKSCKSDNYRVYPNLNNINKCLPNCDGINNTISKRVNNSRSDYECQCIDLWYEDSDGIIHCNNDIEKKSCESAFKGKNKNYLIKETKECVQKCEGNYSFLFGNECFNNCNDIKNYYEFVAEGDINNICRCPKLWKNETGKIVCINGDICHESNYIKLISATNECVNECPQGYKEFNNICYETCAGNLENDTINNNLCKCAYKWYKYNDNALNITNIIVCLGEKDECPKDFYPYLDNANQQCVESTSNCSSTIVFNYTCYDICPGKTKKKESENTCECDIDYGKWYQYTYEGKILYQCGLDRCPDNKKYLDIDSQECKYICENKYHYQNSCYTECPQNTKVIDELTKECVDTYTFEESTDLKSLEENIKTNIKTIYEKTTSNGIIYNINNSTMQLYGVNKNKEDKKDVIMRNNLTYIDLSYCLDKLYEKNGLTEDTDIIIVKYDLAEKTNGSTINPVEFKVINSKTGEEIPLDACEDNSIVISYPLMNILNNFVIDSNNLRSLEEEKNNKNLNLREKFLKGKEIYIDNEEIDTFDLSNKLYTDICYPFKINGRDLILEDRLNYLYPFCSFCESNCIYNKTDFISERVYCNCNPKDEINFERNLELMNSDPDMAKAKKRQKASILKCLGKISEISKNFGFFYGLIIILAEIAMCILTFLYSYKVFVMRINRKFEIKRGDNNNNINTENLESVNLSGRDKNYNKNEEIIKTSERNLENPPKKKIQININETKEDKKEKRKDNKKKTANKREELIGNADIINIKKTGKDKISQRSNDDKLSSNGYNLYVEKSTIVTFKDSEDENIFELIKLESTLLTVDYQKALQKNKAEILIMILTEILDKIYIIKAIWLLQKYAIVSLYVSLYLLWHMLIISFLSLFYNYSNLHKIWINDNYPNLNFHLGFGFLSCLISFIFYKGLCFLIFNDRKIAELESIPKENKNEIGEKYNKMMFWAKIKIIIFYAIVFILCIIFFLYLMAFCGVNIGAKARLFESYGIALIEVVIIKILYGIVLGILRKISLTYEIKNLYFIVRILDLYIS